MIPILASQYAPSEVPCVLLTCAVGALIHRRLTSNEFFTAARLTIIWFVSLVLLSAAIVIYGHNIGRYTGLIGPLAVATGAAPALIAEKALHYRWQTKRIRPAAVFGLATFLLVMAGVVYQYLSRDLRVENFYSTHRAITPWVLWPSIAVVLCVPSRYFLPYSVIGILNAYSKFGGGYGFGGWPGSAAMTEPWHSIVTHFGPFFLLGVWLESLSDVTRKKAG